MKKCSEVKMMWAVRAYQQWRSSRITDSETFDINIFDSNLEDFSNVTKEKLEHSLCIFLAEVKKVNGDEYPGKTLYQLVVSIQRYLNERQLNWKLVEGPDFKNLRVVLDNLMKERVMQNIGTTTHQAQFIPLDFESELWQKGILGEDTPEKLRSTVLFLIGINCALHAGDEHHDLRHDTPTKPSQFSFKRNKSGECCVVYREDTVTKTNDGGLAHMRKERKVVWIFPSQNVVRCPVRLIDKYISLCPPVGKNGKSNFYLRSLEKITPAQWYSTRVLGVNAIRKTVTEMLKSAKLDGFFTNHSLCRSGTTRLFQAGVDRKIIKEFTGHSSDAVDNYQVTSEGQCREISSILAGECKESSLSNPQLELPVQKESDKEQHVSTINTVELTVNDEINGCGACTCKLSNMKLSESEKIGQIVTRLLDGEKYSKATIKLEVEFSE